MKSKKKISTAKVLLLTIATFGLYGAYWAMTQSVGEADFEDDEVEKDADAIQRAAASAMLMRHDLH